MAKYSYELKKQIVMEYLNGQGGTRFLAKKYGIPNHAQIQRWIAAYQKFGDSGLMRSRKNESYLKKQRESSTASEENSNGKIFSQ